ncbi:hypothetical protein [Actinopolymorpha alba]|uniref:hypothetical protein n=1 Tax=Actinopolymorpha alba TaxID=533267 RepID=UPI0003749AB4|nr:hypothetical protein [Actinopolymorpha alba]
MGRIVATEYISVDGVNEAPSGSETFEHAGAGAPRPKAATDEHTTKEKELMFSPGAHSDR